MSSMLGSNYCPWATFNYLCTVDPFFCCFFKMTIFFSKEENLKVKKRKSIPSERDVKGDAHKDSLKSFNPYCKKTS